MHGGILLRIIEIEWLRLPAANDYTEGPPVSRIWVGGSPLKKRVSSALLLKHRLRALESRYSDGKAAGVKDTDTGTSQDYAYVRITPQALTRRRLPGGLASMEQAERGAVARRAGQRSPSEKTWALILGKLERRKAA